MIAPAPIPPFDGVLGTARYVAEVLADAGHLHPVGAAALFGAGAGLLTAAATWIGAQDYVPGTTFDPGARSGMDGAPVGASQNDMHPNNINAHRNPGGAGADRFKGCGTSRCRPNYDSVSRL